MVKVGAHLDPDEVQGDGLEFRICGDQLADALAEVALQVARTSRPLVGTLPRIYGINRATGLRPEPGLMPETRVYH